MAALNSVAVVIAGSNEEAAMVGSWCRGASGQAE